LKEEHALRYQASSISVPELVEGEEVPTILAATSPPLRCAKWAAERMLRFIPFDRLRDHIGTIYSIPFNRLRDQTRFFISIPFRKLRYHVGSAAS